MVPTLKLKHVTRAALTELMQEARQAPRRRKNLNLHDSLADEVQRFLNVFQPGTYVRPHRHADKWELFVLVSGKAAVVLLDDAGSVQERVDLGDQSSCVVEIPPGVWHTVVSLAPDTALFEVKRGPYDATSPAEYAPWAPAEGDANVGAFVDRLQAANIGEPLCRD